MAFYGLRPMELFPKSYNPELNLLPRDGSVHYYGSILDKDLADSFMQDFLQNIAWERDVAVLFGKRIETKRKVAWYGDEEYPYTYSNNTKYALSWTKSLLDMKQKIESVCGASFNSCLMNLYHDGNEGMAWHSDGEKDLKKHGVIASLSLGAERKFCFKHKESKEKIDVFLEHGSLLIMKDKTQDFWLHRLPPTKKVSTARINLTFRNIIEKDQ